MTAGRLRILVGATTAPWCAALRSYVRDHAQGAQVEVVMDRAGLSRALPGADALVLDDVMRNFSSSDVFRAQRCGAFVIGVADQKGAGREYLAQLGVDKVVPASLPPAELLALAYEAAEAAEGSEVPSSRPEVQARVARERAGPLGRVSAWTKVSGGAGLSEAVVAAAEELSRRWRVLLVEAEELAPVMVSRLSRSPDAGLPLALSRAAQGVAALPEALSLPRQESPTVGHFDVVCAAANPAQPLNPSHLERFISEAASSYDCVVVETCWLVGSPSARERFSAARAVLQRASSVVVLASPDPEGAARLVQWKALALSYGVDAPAWAVFGRARASAYERSHLGSIVEANTGRHPFAGISFLPEDPAVARARWNGELVWKGPFQKAVAQLAAECLAGPGAPERGLRRGLRRQAQAGRGVAEAPPRNAATSRALVGAGFELTACSETVLAVARADGAVRSSGPERCVPSGRVLR